MSATLSAKQSEPDEHVATPSQTQLSQHATPAKQVFATPELLEMILLFACSDDPTTAFLSRRVNSFFKETISGSIALQRALFLRRDMPHPPIEDETGVRINPIFDCTGVADARRYIEVYNFGTQWVPMEPDTESVDVWCEDCILMLRNGPLFDMVLLKRRWGNRNRVCLDFYFRLSRMEDLELPEAVRVPMKFEDWESITIGQVIEKARAKLGEWYPEHYGDKGVAKGGTSVQES